MCLAKKARHYACMYLIKMMLRNKKLTNTPTNFHEKIHKDRAGGRAVDLGGPKCENKHKSCCLQGVSLLIGRAKHVDWRGPGPPWRRPCMKNYSLWLYKFHLWWVQTESKFPCMPFEQVVIEEDQFLLM